MANSIPEACMNYAKISLTEKQNFITWTISLSPNPPPPKFCPNWGSRGCSLGPNLVSWLFPFFRLWSVPEAMCLLEQPGAQIQPEHPLWPHQLQRNQELILRQQLSEVTFTLHQVQILLDRRDFGYHEIMVLMKKDVNWKVLIQAGADLGFYRGGGGEGSVNFFKINFRKSCINW